MTTTRTATPVSPYGPGYLPVYLKGGFNVRQRPILGWAATAETAGDLIKDAYPRKQVGANGLNVTNGPHGVELLADDLGSYYVAKWRLMEHS